MQQNFGIKVSTPESSTLLHSHLLGKDWCSYRWYSTAAERDAAFIKMQEQPGNYRIGDTIQQILEKVDD